MSRIYSGAAGYCGYEANNVELLLDDSKRAKRSAGLCAACHDLAGPDGHSCLLLLWTWIPGSERLASG